jgi:hypothetical protein
VREAACRNGDSSRLVNAEEVIAVPGPGAQSRKSITGERLAQAIALGVGHSRVGENLDQPVVIIWMWK